MKKIFLSVFTIIGLLACNEQEQSKFSLKGDVNGTFNETLIYLKHENEIIDSVIVKNNFFVFNTELPYSPIILVVNNPSNPESIKAIYAENKPMTFSSKNGNFLNAEVKGSKSHDESEIIKKKFMDIQFEREELERFGVNADLKLRDSLFKKYKDLEAKQSSIFQKFIINHPNSIVSIDILSHSMVRWGTEKSTELYNSLSMNSKNSTPGIKLQRQIDLYKDPKTGDRFIDFSMKDQYGNIRRLSELEGKTIMLNFTSSGCLPCKVEHPYIVDTYKNFKSKGLEIVEISLDKDRKRWMSTIKDDSIDWIHLSDLKGWENKAAIIYGVHGIPDNVLIDNNGVIAGRKLGSQELNNTLSKLLN